MAATKKIRVGNSFTIESWNGRKDKYDVLRVFPTKSDADGPLPSTLLRIVKARGGAAIVQLLPSKDERVVDDMLIGRGYSRPALYVIALDANGERDGFPVWLAPHQIKRLQRYA